MKQQAEQVEYEKKMSVYRANLPSAPMVAAANHQQQQQQQQHQHVDNGDMDEEEEDEEEYSDEEA